MLIKHFYLMTPLKLLDYVKIKLSNIPDKVVENHDLRAKDSPDDLVFVAITKGMYGLSQI